MGKEKPIKVEAEVTTKKNVSSGIGKGFGITIGIFLALIVIAVSCGILISSQANKIQEKSNEITANAINQYNQEVKKVEDLVNFAVGKKYHVEMKEMAYEDALKLGAQHFFKEKYPARVKVYLVGDFKVDPPEIFSRELCSGPHVKNTSEIGRFKILKQEAVGSGIRRIRATVE